MSTLGDVAYGCLIIAVLAFFGVILWYAGVLTYLVLRVWNQNRRIRNAVRAFHKKKEGPWV